MKVSGQFLQSGSEIDTLELKTLNPTNGDTRPFLFSGIVQVNFTRSPSMLWLKSVTGAGGCERGTTGGSFFPQFEIAKKNKTTKIRNATCNLLSLFFNFGAIKNLILFPTHRAIKNQEFSPCNLLHQLFLSLFDGCFDPFCGCTAQWCSPLD